MLQQVAFLHLHKLLNRIPLIALFCLLICRNGCKPSAQHFPHHNQGCLLRIWLRYAEYGPNSLQGAHLFGSVSTSDTLLCQCHNLHWHCLLHMQTCSSLLSQTSQVLPATSLVSCWPLPPPVGPFLLLLAPSSSSSLPPPHLLPPNLSVSLTEDGKISSV